MSKDKIIQEEYRYIQSKFVEMSIELKQAEAKYKLFLYTLPIFQSAKILEKSLLAHGNKKSIEYLTLKRKFRSMRKRVANAVLETKEYKDFKFIKDEVKELKKLWDYVKECEVVEVV